MSRLALKRVYDEAGEDDGTRVLADRMWPRGISKDDERIDEWFKEVAPTDELRKWFHKSGDFPNFSKKYRKELKEHTDTRRALDELLDLARGSNHLTLVYASKDSEHNNAVVLKDVVEGRV